ncbi:DUF4920 domain-containing protein [Flavobacterium sp.]|jgi:hypothetical protein|uniref:DUF4920 domain-containing protein n=1 Tax=Flavobacterium sp. TaxID=239 RepID=UPI0037BE2443
MKKLLILLSVFILAISCNKKETKIAAKPVFASFGDKITEESALTKEVVLEKYKTLKLGDTIELKVASKINEICQNKGCWMTLDLGNDETAFVKFKDYGFFVPMNAQKRETIIEGKAFVEETSVAELKHYAEDEGKTPEEIAKIKAPKTEYKFLAHGVLISK